MESRTRFPAYRIGRTTNSDTGGSLPCSMMANGRPHAKAHHHFGRCKGRSRECSTKRWSHCRSPRRAREPSWPCRHIADGPPGRASDQWNRPSLSGAPPKRSRAMQALVMGGRQASGHVGRVQSRGRQGEPGNPRARQRMAHGKANPNSMANPESETRGPRLPRIESTWGGRQAGEV